jgi:hypothetical protein
MKSSILYRRCSDKHSKCSNVGVAELELPPVLEQLQLRMLFIIN